MFDSLFKNNDFFGKNGTMQQVSSVANSIQASKSDNAISRLEGLSGIVAKILSFFV